jgi:predicted acylesterase/phospholipase RssA
MDASVASEPAASPDEAPTSRGETKLINLALQGGGAHSAFTWGVLERLIEDDRIGFDGISATSAGAMNATVFASGIATGGREGAKKALAKVLAPDQPGVIDESAAADLIGSSFRPSLDGAIARVRLFRTDDPVVLAVRVQPSRPESSTGRPIWIASISPR